MGLHRMNYHMERGQAHRNYRILSEDGGEAGGAGNTHGEVPCRICGAVHRENEMPHGAKVAAR